MTADPTPSLHLAGPWWLWRDAAIRGAGFPLEDLLKLGDVDLAAAADALEQVPGATAGGFHADYTKAVDESGYRLAEIVDGGPFRMALSWQHPKVVENIVEPFLAASRSGAPRDARRRKRENTLVKYVQRYHAKNETVGFFGPVGWARWAQAPAAPLTVTGHHRSIVRRWSYFEDWPVRALAETFFADRETRLHLPPLPSPAVRVEAGRVHTALRGWAEMPRPRLDVLAACDGEATVLDITDRLIAAGTPDIASVADVEKALGELERAGHVTLGVKVPPTTRPDAFLARLFERMAEPGLRERGLAMLRRLRDSADEVRAAGADAGRLAAALSAMETVFTDCGGGRPHRPGAGPMSTGRTLMVEDCRSSATALLGPALLADLAPPLELVLASARWLVDRVAQRYLAVVDRIHRSLTRPGSAEVGLGAVLSEFWPHCSPEAFRAETAEITAQLRQRWADILQAPEDARRHHVAAADIRARALEVFAAQSAPWFSGRFHSPDVMIAASGVDAVARGEYTWVLGELHTAVNSLDQGVFVSAHPEPEFFLAMAEQDARRHPGIIPIYPSGWPKNTGRAYPPPFLVSDCYEYLRFSAEPPRERLPAPGTPIGDLLLVRDDRGTLWVGGRDGRRLHPLAVLGEFLLDSIPDAFKPFAPSGHRPRIAVDRLVIAREQWRVPVADIAWPVLRDEAQRYRAARGWARALALPRFVFVHVAGESKPYYVDLTSPLLVSMIAARLRTMAREHPGSVVTVTEMYPDPDNVWLPHSEPGRRCTSEFRFAIVDRPT